MLFLCMERKVVAIDLGGTKLASAVVDSSGSILARRRCASTGSIPEIAGEAAAVLAEAGLNWDEVSGAALILPGIYNPRTGRAWAPNVWGTDEVPIAGPLGEAIPVRLRIASDRSGYVLGESWLGAAAGLSDVVFLAIGTGIGAGILSGGRILEGTGGVAGAVGWFSLSSEFREAYANMGCQEAEAAGPAVARRAGAVSAENAAELARAGDVKAQAAFAEAARYLGAGVANLISTLNPEMVVVGGGLMHASDLLLDPIRREAGRWAQPIAFRQTRIEMTALGDDAGLLGAARLALDAE